MLRTVRTACARRAHLLARSGFHTRAVRTGNNTPFRSERADSSFVTFFPNKLSLSLSLSATHTLSLGESMVHPCAASGRGPPWMDEPDHHALVHAGEGPERLRASMLVRRSRAREEECAGGATAPQPSTLRLFLFDGFPVRLCAGGKRHRFRKRAGVAGGAV